jgi:anthranilate phosphoribosyltransferase
MGRPSPVFNPARQEPFLSIPSDIYELIRALRAGHSLTREQTRWAFEEIMSGRIEETPMADFLLALAAKGETAEEIAGGADVMNEKVTRVRCDADCIDTCGTGGDGISTFNVSTAAAIIAAGAGATVAKHGSTTNTRVSGSAEVLAELGVNITATVPVLEQCLRDCGIAFLYSPGLHPAMRYAAPARKRLGTRTIFNYLGPLTNPAGARRQVLGVYRPELTDTIARVMLARGAVCAWVVHGNGLCDLSITGPSVVTEVREGRLRTFTVTPSELGLPRGELSDLLVDSPRASAAAILEILGGEPGPRRNHAVLNAAGALVVAGLTPDLRSGIERACASIDEGCAEQVLRKLIEASRRGH